MGFFARLIKSLFGQGDTAIEESAESDSQVSPVPFIEPGATAVAPFAFVAHHQLSDLSAPGGAPAVAVAGLVGQPALMIQSSGMQVGLLDEHAGPEVFLDDFDQDLDDAFASLVNHNAAPESENTCGEMTRSDQLVVEQLFADIASNYARPIKNFIFELRRGTATKEWIEICRPAMHSIARSAEGMGLSSAAQRMVDFEAALVLAQNSEQRVLGAEIRNTLLRCYEDLTEALPQAFVVGEEEQEREGIIINSLLMQIPGMGRVSVAKLYSAGLTSLETLFLARKDDLAAVTGIPVPLSERICEKFQAYRAELEGHSRDLSAAGQRARLSELLADLRRLHDGFQQAGENEGADPSLAAGKRDYRQRRQSCLLQINVVLAEIGELQLVSALQKLSFARRIRSLEEFLASPPASMN